VALKDLLNRQKSLAQQFLTGLSTLRKGGLSAENAVLAARNLMNAGIIRPADLRHNIETGFESQARKMVKKARKKGRGITVDEILEGALKCPQFLELCEELGMSREYLEGLAKKAIEEG